MYESDLSMERTKFPTTLLSLLFLVYLSLSISSFFLLFYTYVYKKIKFMYILFKGIGNIFKKMQTTEFNHVLFEKTSSESSEESNIDNHEFDDLELEETELDDLLCEEDGISYPNVSTSLSVEDDSEPWEYTHQHSFQYSNYIGDADEKGKIWKAQAQKLEEESNSNFVSYLQFDKNPRAWFDTHPTGIEINNYLEDAQKIRVQEENREHDLFPTKRRTYYTKGDSLVERCKSWNNRLDDFNKQRETSPEQKEEKSSDECIPGYSCESMSPYNGDINYFTNTELETIERTSRLDNIRDNITTRGPFMCNPTYILGLMETYKEYIPLDLVTHMFIVAKDCTNREPSESQKTTSRDIIRFIITNHLDDPMLPKVLSKCLQVTLSMPRFNMWLLKILFKLGVKCTEEQYAIEVSKKRSPAFLRLLQEHCEKQPISQPEPQTKVYTSKETVSQPEPQTEKTKETKVMFQMSWKTGSFSFDITRGKTSIKEASDGTFHLDVQLE